MAGGSSGMLPGSFHDHGKNNTLTFLDCHFTVKVKGQTKHILKGISGEVKSGELLAIMGPSGAGKTTLLNILTMNPQGGMTEGTVTLNGHPLTGSLFKEFCSYVPQEDHLWAFLTCRECIEYAAAFTQKQSKADKKAAVDSLLSKIGLESCQNTRVGNIFFKGLSGGQKRRCSLAVALAKTPAVLFLDEPTSGLDSTSAASIMGFLKDLAKETNIIVICTIHQPSTEVFHGFDKTLILADGRTAYLGGATETVQYLHDIGEDVPHNHNPAEYFLDVVNKDFTDPKEVELVMNAWKERAPEIKAAPKSELPNAAHEKNFLVQVINHLKRGGILSLRDPLLYWGRAILFVIACIFFAVVYIRSRDRYQNQVVGRMFLTMWFIAVPCCMAVIACYGLNVEFYAIKREVKDGMYNFMSYIISQAIIQIPYMVILALAAIGISGYAITNFYAANFGLMLIVYSVNLWSFEQFAQLFAILFKNPLFGMLVFMCIWFSSFLFAGFFVPQDDIIWPFRIFVWILPLRWTISSVIKTEFRDATFLQATEDFNNPRGFVCDADVNEQECYGRTGEQVLTSLQALFDVVNPSETYAKDVGIIVAIGAVVKIFFTILVYIKTRHGAPPKPPGSSPWWKSGGASWADTSGSDNKTGYNAARSNPYPYQAVGARGDLAYAQLQTQQQPPASPMALDPAHQPQNGNGMAQYQVPLVVEKPGYNITKDRADHAEVEEFRTVASAYPMLNVPQAPPPREEPTTPPTLVEEPPAPEVTHNGNGNGAAHDGQPSASERRKLFKAQSAATTSASTLFGSTSFGTSKANNVFTFRDCRFTVKKKEILKGVSGQVRSGNVLAIMGPSGAGKTTLLNLLTLSNNNGECEGDVTLNGNTISTSILRRHCAYVAQEDHLWAFFTTRQCLDYVAALSLASPREDRDRIIDGLITRLGLKVCENTRVGNPFLKGLSGGQKRRLSLALALIKNPAVLFLDEPTSGLDSASAAEIMKFLGEIAVELDTIVICTIHQPSSTVFEAFDQTMVLSDGQVAYSGRAADCSEYFEGIGLPIPELHNPAEFMLDKVNKDWVDAAAVEKVLRHYKQTERAIPPVSQGTLPIPMEQADFFSQTITHVKRMFHNSFKDPTLWLSRVFINNIATIFFAVIYIKSRTRYQDMALPRMFMCMWTIGVPACMGIIAVGALSLEFFAVKREIKDGIYSCWSYLLANAIVQIPFIFLLSLCSIGISLYAMLDYDPAQFGLMLVLYAFALWSFEQFAQLCSILVKNFLIGMLIFVCIWFTSFLFAGFFNKAEDIPWPLRVFVYIFPLRWTISNMAKLEFDSDKTFGGAEPANNELGFTCLPGVEPCVGYTSQQVLKSIGQNFTLFQGERELGKDLGILLAIGITVKLFYCILFWFRTLDSKAPKKRS